MGILNAILSARIAKLFGIPFVYYLIDSLHTLIPEKYLRPFGRYVESRSLKLADEILAINKHLGNYARRMGASQEPKIITAGIDRTRFNLDVDGTTIRRKLGIHENEMVIFFMGWLYDFSGLRDVAKSVSETTSGVRLLVLGRGDLQDELKDLSAKANGSKIKVVDWVSYENVPKYVSAADICVLPAHLNEIMRDIVPIKLYEYLACGKPVIATKLPGVVKEFGRNSGIVYADNPQSVVKVAIKNWEDKRKYAELRKAALETSKSFDWKDITERFLQLLENLVNEKMIDEISH